MMGTRNSIKKNSHIKKLHMQFAHAPKLLKASEIGLGYIAFRRRLRQIFIEIYDANYFSKMDLLL